jgi:hypothetical protein
MQMILPRPGISDVEVSFHIRPLAQVAIQVGVRAAVAVLAVYVTDAPGWIFYLASGKSCIWQARFYLSSVEIQALSFI